MLTDLLIFALMRATALSTLFTPRPSETARAPREMFTTVCANCGKEAKVPFQPSDDRPVYCSECFAAMKNNG